MTKKIFFIYVNFLFFHNACFVANSKVVVISQKEILEKTAQGQSALHDIYKFEKKMIAELDEHKAKVAASEAEYDKLSQELEQQKNSVSQDLFVKKSQALKSASVGLRAFQDQFYETARKTKEVIDNHFEFATKRFFKDLMLKHAPIFGWDIVLSAETALINYSISTMNGTSKLLSALKKQSDIQSKKYTTVAEIKKLFEDLGLIYLVNNKKDEKMKTLEALCAAEVYGENVNLYEHRQKLYSKFIQAQERASTYVAWVSDKVGWGVFAQKDIREGEFIQEYTGVIDEVVPNFDTTYAWILCSMRMKRILAADSLKEGNEMRFVNHSNHPNVMSLVVITKDNTFHVCYVAKAFIKAGEQLLVSYGNNYWTARNYFEQM